MVSEGLGGSVGKTACVRGTRGPADPDEFVSEVVSVRVKYLHFLLRFLPTPGTAVSTVSV